MDTTDCFLRQLSATQMIKDDQMNSCERPITLDEVLTAIRRLKHNKSPGTDGLSAEFYVAFAEQLSRFLLKCIHRKSY